MSDEWDEYAEGWDNNKDVVAYSEKAFISLLDTVSLKGMRVLDFGCGTGLLTEKISSLAKEVVALDTSEKMISVLANKNLPNVMIVRDEISGDLISESRLFSEKFDIIVASSVCSFLPELEKTLALLKLLLVPGGVFVQWDWLSNEENNDFGLSRKKIINAYDKAGLELVSLDQVFSVSGPDGDMPVLKGMAKNI